MPQRGQASAIVGMASRTAISSAIVGVGGRQNSGCVPCAASDICSTPSALILLGIPATKAGVPINPEGPNTCNFFNRATPSSARNNYARQRVKMHQLRKATTNRIANCKSLNPHGSWVIRNAGNASYLLCPHDAGKLDSTDGSHQPRQRISL